jgi:putative endonuclease
MIPPMNRERRYYVYILQSTSRHVLYTGVTSNIERRIFEHKNHVTGGFTSEYNAKRLVLLEHYSDIRTAIEREKQLKG